MLMSKGDRSETCEYLFGAMAFDRPTDQVTKFVTRHEDLLENLGIYGKGFVEQNEALVVQMTRKYLEYVKSIRVGIDNAENRGAESDSINIRMTSRGYPIIPKIVMERELKKAKWETILRAFLAQHYCKQPSRLKFMVGC